jgi:hypothetical protein
MALGRAPAFVPWSDSQRTARNNEAVEQGPDDEGDGPCHEGTPSGRPGAASEASCRDDTEGSRLALRLSPRARCDFQTRM